MNEFNTVCTLDRVHFIGACVIYPKGCPSHVLVELATDNKIVGRVFYKLGLPLSEEDARQVALQRFLADGWVDRLIEKPGDYAGESLG